MSVSQHSTKAVDYLHVYLALVNRGIPSGWDLDNDGTTDSNVFRLSSKSHWNISVEIDRKTVHILASHPTPPVFDAEEDRNGKRNYSEIRLRTDFITPGNGDYIDDDNVIFGRLKAKERFVIVDDQNADRFDGDSTDNAILQLLDNPSNTSVIPESEGGVDASDRTNDFNNTHFGNHAFDTGNFNDAEPSNLRVSSCFTFG